MVTDSKGYTRILIAIVTVLESSQSAKLFYNMQHSYSIEEEMVAGNHKWKNFFKVHELCKTTVGDP